MKPNQESDDIQALVELLKNITSLQSLDLSSTQVVIKQINQTIIYCLIAIYYS